MAPDSDTIAASPPAEPAPVPVAVPLPAVQTGLSRDQVLERLRTASRRGRLAGFEAPAKAGGLFCAAAFGKPFDETLIGDAKELPGGGTTLRFRTRLLPTLPAVYMAVLLLTVWPGAYFMDELIAQFLPGLWSPWVTYWWYVPLTAIPIPWVWRGLRRRSRAAAHDAAHVAVRKIAAEVEGVIVAPNP